MKKITISKTKRFFTLTLVFMLIFSSLPAVPVWANQQETISGLNLQPQRTVVNANLGSSWAVRGDGSLWAWGTFLDGRVGFADSTVPVRLMDGVTSVSGGYGGLQAWVIKDDNSLWAWGYNWWGGFGIDVPLGFFPTPVRIMDNVASVTHTQSGGFAIQTDGTLWSWGNDFRAFTPQFDANHIRPERVMDNVASISFSGFNDGILAIVRSDGRLYMVGDNSFGQIGDGTRSNRWVPVRIMDNVVEAVTGGSAVMAVQADGSLWHWGSGNLFLEGDVMNDRLRPVRVMDNVASVALSSNAFAVRTDGTLWSWGYESGGRLGNGILGGNVQHMPVGPFRIMDSVVSVSADTQHALVVRSDGSLWAFGAQDGYSHPIGDGTTQSRPSPVMIMDPGSISTNVGAVPPTQPTQPVTPPTTPPIIPPQTGQFTMTTIASPAQGGTVSGGGTFQENTQVTLTATPNQGWTFTGWFVNDSLWTQNPTVTTQALNNWTFEARFTPPAMPPIITQTP